MNDLILAFITSFSLTYLAIPSIIHVSHKKNLMDEPGVRRVHKVSTPSLGGIGIFAGVVFSILMWTPFTYFSDLQFILCAMVVIFLIGVKDDLDPTSPVKKLLGQLFASFILVFKANIKLTSFYGVFGVYDLPPVVSIVFSIFTILVIINSMNLIDGINGLSSGIGLLFSTFLGYWFFSIDRIEIAILAFSLTGSLVAFLKFNVTPAKIFMGDTGSLMVGLIGSILVILFIELQGENKFHPLYFPAAPALGIAILILPLFDTVRVFAIRIMRGKSPFSRIKITYIIYCSKRV
jgi:UDP-N-acetylmuramyl pentapeptide phosphotransferase/UDP-N-acetylglucosamine-1-phosphate transferase